MDNAPYHKEFVDGSFIPSKEKKDEIKTWLESN